MKAAGDQNLFSLAETVDHHESDTTIVLKLLGECGGEEGMTLSLISSFRGPFSFIFYHRSTQRLWFARDYFGRRSLCVRPPNRTDPVLYIASLTIEEACTEGSSAWEEIPADGVYCLDLNFKNTQTAGEEERRLVDGTGTVAAGDGDKICMSDIVCAWAARMRYSWSTEGHGVLRVPIAPLNTTLPDEGSPTHLLSTENGAVSSVSNLSLKEPCHRSRRKQDKKDKSPTGESGLIPTVPPSSARAPSLVSSSLIVPPVLCPSPASHGLLRVLEHAVRVRAALLPKDDALTGGGLTFPSVGILFSVRTGVM